MHTDLNRRQFLAAGALTLTAAGLAGCTSTSKTTSFVGPDSAAVEKALAQCGGEDSGAAEGCERPGEHIPVGFDGGDVKG